jgi:hypothetical protein
LYEQPEARPLYAKRLPEKLTAAGDHSGAALYNKVRGEIVTAFQTPPDDPRQMRQADQPTAKVWLLARSAGVNGLKPRSSLFSKKLGPRHHSLLLFRFRDRRRRITVVYWVQRRGYWKMARVLEALAGRYPEDVPTFGEILESKLRHRVFWPGSQPGRWERLLSTVNEGRRLAREDVVQPDAGVRPGQAGQTEGGGWSGDATRVAAPDGVRPGHVDASQDQATGWPQAAGWLGSVLAHLLPKLLG